MVVKIDILNYENEYQACSNGFIYNKKYNRYLNPKPSIDGYIRVQLCKDGEYKPFLVHQLIANAFLVKPDDQQYEVDHYNHVRSDNRIQNLHWVTHDMNQLNRVFKNQLQINQLPEDAELIPIYKNHICKFTIYKSNDQKQIYQMMDETKINGVYYCQTYDINNKYFSISYKELFGIEFQQI